MSEGSTDVHIIMLHNLDNFLHTPFIFQFHNKIKKCFKYFQTEDQLGEKLLMGPLRQNTDHWFGQKKICFSEMEATHTQME